MRGDTICALCTPPGKGALALIRISGPKSVESARKIAPFLPQKPESRRAYVGILKKEREDLDQAVLTYFAEGKSFTGEETLEIVCHGGQVYNEILEGLLASGVRLAERGEFSLRAFLNGKMDLAQAEGIFQLIESETLLARRQAFSQMKGLFSKKLAALEKKWLSLLSHIEAGIDFSMEGINPMGADAAGAALKELKAAVEGDLLPRYRPFEKLQKGLLAGIFGSVNSGKSSLFNALLGEEKAIVSNEEGATRDLVEGNLPNSQGLSLSLRDTAGFWPGPLPGQALSRSLMEKKPKAPAKEKSASRAKNEGQNLRDLRDLRDPRNLRNPWERPPPAHGRQGAGLAEKTGRQKAAALWQNCDIQILVMDASKLIFKGGGSSKNGLFAPESLAAGKASQSAPENSLKNVQENVQESSQENIQEDSRESSQENFPEKIWVLAKKDLCPPEADKEKILRRLRSAGGLSGIFPGNFPGIYPETSPPIPADRVFFVSALTGEGIAALKEKLFSFGKTESEGFLISNCRHYKGLLDMKRSLERAEEVFFSGGEKDLMALELREGLLSLQGILGRQMSDDLLDSIFRQFCIGK